MKKIILLVVSWLWLSCAHAFTPEGGLWVIDAENNGQPGRGFEIDIQGRTFVLTFYGYKPDGGAQWYLSAGMLSGNSFSGTLDQYEGGMALGTGQVSAHGTGNAGNVSMTFSDATHGAISLPGEGWKTVSRMNFARPSDPNSLTGTYELERVVVVYEPSGTILDSQSNVSVSGTMYVDGSVIQQSMSMTKDGTTASVTLNGALTDFGSYVNFVTTQGVTSSARLIKRGDELITLVVTSSATELDSWRRISASGFINTIHSAPAFLGIDPQDRQLQPGAGLGLILGAH